MNVTLPVKHFSISGGNEQLRLELSFKGPHGLEPRHYQGKSITFADSDGTQITLGGEIIGTPWPAELQILIWPSAVDLQLMTTFLEMLLPSTTVRTKLTITMDSP